MDTKSYEKKRGRAKKKVEALRASLEGGNASSTSSLNEVANELQLPDTFQDFRARTSSNASSIGRLSPIQSALESDLHDNQVPPISPIPWNQPTEGLPNNFKTKDFTETLTESLAEMFVGDTMNALSPVENLVNQESSMVSTNMSTPSPIQPQMSPASSSGMQGFGADMLRAPPPYPDQPLQSSPQQLSPQQAMMGNNMGVMGNGMGAISPNAMSPMPPGMANGMDTNMGDDSQSLMNNTQDTFLGMMQQTNGMLAQEMIGNGLMSSLGMRTTLGTTNQYNAFQNTSGMHALGQTSPQQQQQQQQQQRQQLLQQQANMIGLNNSLLRQALTKEQQQLQQQRQQQQQQGQMPNNQQQQISNLQQLLAGGQVTVNQSAQQAQQMMAGGGMTTIQHQLPNMMPQDIDFNLCGGEFDCDVDQIINHELSFDGNLDFNFEMQQAQQQAAQQVAAAQQQQQQQGQGDNQFNTIQT